MKKANLVNLAKEMVPDFTGNGLAYPTFLTGLESGLLLSEKRPDVAAQILDVFRNGDYYVNGNSMMEDVDDVVEALGVA